MYSSIFNSQQSPEEISINLNTISEKVEKKEKEKGKATNKITILSQTEMNPSLGEGNTIFKRENTKALTMKRNIIYIPFIDNNGNIFESFK
jgi:hypothetical protein